MDLLRQKYIYHGIFKTTQKVTISNILNTFPKQTASKVMQPWIVYDIVNES